MRHGICVPRLTRSAGILCRLRTLVAFAVLTEPLPNRHESPLGVHAQLVERSRPRARRPSITAVLLSITNKPVIPYERMSSLAKSQEVGCRGSGQYPATLV